MFYLWSTQRPGEPQNNTKLGRKIRKCLNKEKRGRERETKEEVKNKNVSNNSKGKKKKPDLNYQRAKCAEVTEI